MMATRRAKKEWFVLAVEPGQDKRVRREILRLVKIRSLEKEFGRIVIKHHLEERHRNGKWVPCRVKSYPGYLFVQMRYANETFHVLESCKRYGAFGLLNLKPQLGGKRYPKKEKMQNTPAKKWEREAHEEWMPTSVPNIEMAFVLLNEMQVNKDKKELKKKGKIVTEEPAVPQYKVGDQVRIIVGTFVGFEGKVTRAQPSQDGQTLTVEILVMDRATKIGVSNNDVERKV